MRYQLAFVIATLALLVTTSTAAQPLPERVRRWQHEWPRTDFSQHTVPLEEIISGGPPKDGIPPIDEPRFVSVAEAADWLSPAEPVLVYRHDDDARAYPLQILLWHEVVNDTVGGQPVVATYCPLCNSALVFDRRLDGRVLDFGTTGKLRHSDLVMWDRQSESWWQQLTGEAIVGELAGERLTLLSAGLVAFRTFRDTYPQGRVLSRETGFSRDYGSNPYVHYDSAANTQPFLFRGSVDTRLPAVERVVTLEIGGVAKAYPYKALAAVGPVNDTVGGRAVVVLFREDVRSALDARTLAGSRKVGSGAVFGRTVRGRTLSFERRGDALVDRQTGSRWNLLGQAVAGELAGTQLPPIVHGNHFAFAWLAFRPDSAVYRAR